MKARTFTIASLIITYNRVNEAKAQMDIIREAWEPVLGPIDIYHEFNGKKSRYPKKYRENFLHRHKSMPHYIGANYLMNIGFKHILESGRNYDYIIASSSDTWFYDAKKLKRIITACLKRRFQLATSLWFGVIFGTEFFVITPDLARKVFPLKFTNIINKYRPLKWVQTRISIFESVFTLQVIGVLKNPNKIYLIPGRRAIWLSNRFYSPNFYASHHDRNQRKKDIMPKIHKILGDRLNNMPHLKHFWALSKKTIFSV